MDVLDFIRETNRMCKSFGDNCEDCPASDVSGCMVDQLYEEIVPIVEKWSKENPRKTRQSEFLKLFPDADTCMPEGCLTLNPCQFYQKMYTECDNKYKCAECRRKFWNQEVE